MKDMLKYSRYFNQIYNPNKYDPEIDTSEKDINEIKNSLKLLRELKIGVINPYLLQLFESYNSQEISVYDFKKSLGVIEDYLFRRAVCELPTNSLDSVFKGLHNEIINLKGNDVGYYEKLKHVLLSKTGSSHFPNNDEFTEKLRTRDIYNHRNYDYTMYLLERLENYGSEEMIDIESLKSNNNLSIEHVMPQTLSEYWIKSLGGEKTAKEIHKKMGE